METPPAHRERCPTASACGAWLERNGEAIYATHPWTPSAATTSNGQQVRFTQKDATVYAIVLGDQLADSLTVHGLRLPAGSRVGLLHGPADLAWSQGDGDLQVMLPPPPGQHAHVLRITTS
jgi:alpha-L-fucosidase